MKLQFPLAALLALFVFCACKKDKVSPCDGPSGGVSFRESFEEIPLADFEWSYELFDSQSVALDTERVEGDFALRLTVRPGELVNNGNRAEVSIPDSDPLCTEAWQDWAFQLPADYALTCGNDWQLIAQWHDQPDAAKGETWDDYPGHSPMLAFYIGCEVQGQIQIAVWYGLAGEDRDIGRANIALGQWHRLRTHTYWSGEEDGFVEVWLDGTPVTAWNGVDNKVFGPNMYNNAPAYFKMGLYRSQNINSTNSILIDDFRRGNSLAEIE